MKKHQIFLICAILFIAIMPSAITMAAEVIYVEGKVQVQSPSDDQWRAVEKGMKAEIGDSFRTARHSLCDIALDEAKLNVIRIDPKTMVILNSDTEGTVDRLDLARGRVFANLEDLKSGMSFEVNTPSAIAGVRGSSYSVYVERDQDEVVAFKDTVFLKTYDAGKNQLSDIMIPEGFKTFVERFGEAAVLMQISTQEFNHFDFLLDDLSASVEGKMEERAKREAEREAARKAQEEQKPQIQQIEETLDTQNSLDEVIENPEIKEERNSLESLQDYFSGEEEPQQPEQPEGGEGEGEGEGGW